MIEARSRRGAIELAAEATARIAALLAPSAGSVLLDVPSHSNVGDSAIWLGTRALLAEIGREPDLEADIDGFDPACSKAIPADRTVLISGGGNLGDLWPRHQTHRERAIAAFRDRSVIQLPQSLCFRSAGALERARATLAGHPDLTLLCRDERSARLAHHCFPGARTLRCPDLALCLPLARLETHRSPRPKRDVLWLLRSDHESAWRSTPSVPGAARDWLDEPASPAAALARWLAPRVAARGAGAARRLHARALRQAAADRLARGIRLLTSARVVVTDRLHGHILCAMLGIPHVLIDDAFGKIDAHCTTWPGLAGLACRVADPREARDRARTLLDGGAG